MPHADSSYLPESVKTKSELWSHIYSQLDILLQGQQNWVRRGDNFIQQLLENADRYLIVPMRHL